MINLEHCPLCGKSETKKFLSCVDYTVSKEKFTIAECVSCGFAFTNPIPDIERIGDYYQSEEYISHSNTKKGLVANLYHAVRSYTLKGKLNKLNQLVSRGTMLDYGCGTGMFLGVCKKDGWNCVGIEVDNGAASIARESGCEIYNSKEQLNAKNDSIKFDAISMWHVLEHVVDLKETLGFLTNSLNKGGVMIIALPNYKSFDAKHYAEFWAAYDLPRHLYHFDKKSINMLVTGFGLELIETKGMLFDSYYVSMLSEKYKTGKIKYVKALYYGFLSNLIGFFSKEYSSHIYVFRKK